MVERISSAAIKLFPSGEVFIGTSHAEIRKILPEGWVDCLDGFVTNHNQFVRRRLAASIALSSGQVKIISMPRLGLMSHDLD